MLEQLTHTDFETHLDSSFVIHYSTTDSFTARLLNVQTLGRQPEDPGKRWPYSLLFHVSEKEQYLVQQIYRVSHPLIGSLDIFLVPVGPDETGMRYESIFT